MNQIKILEILEKINNKTINILFKDNKHQNQNLKDHKKSLSADTHKSIKNHRLPLFILNK